MANKLPPTPLGVPPGHVYWNQWYEQLRSLVNNAGISVTWNSIDFTGSDITDIVSRPHNSLQSLQGGGGGEFYHLTNAQNSGLTGGTDTTLHFHSSDRNRANHTGTQLAATISDFNTAADARVTTGIAAHVALADPHVQYQKESEKDAVSGYAGLNAVSRTTKGVDTTDYLVVDSATTGLVLKDTAGTPHYWLLTVDTSGVLTTTDLGTTKP